MITPVALVLVTTSWILLGVLSMLRVRRASRVRRAPRGSPPITVLKPLAGADPGLEANLTSFFEQDYPAFELVFGAEDPRDPALAVVERLRARYPGVAVTVVVHGGGGGWNPKVANLRGMLPAAEHDLVLVSDSNVRAPAGYLAELAAAYGDDRRGPVGLVTNVFAGAGERSFGAALENVQLNGFIAAGSSIPTWFGDAAVVGKSMLFSKSVFQRLGGFEAVADLLAEDFIIGKMFQHGGYRVVLGPTILESVNGEVALRAAFLRQLRWSMMRLRLRPLAFVLEPLASPLLMVPFAAATLGLGPAIGWALALVVLRDAGQWLLLRGARRVALPLVLAPVRELFALGVWLLTPFVKRVTWRGHSVRLGAGTHVFVPDLLLEA